MTGSSAVAVPISGVSAAEDWLIYTYQYLARARTMASWAVVVAFVFFAGSMGSSLGYMIFCSAGLALCVAIRAAVSKAVERLSDVNNGLWYTGVAPSPPRDGDLIHLHTSDWASPFVGVIVDDNRLGGRARVVNRPIVPGMLSNHQAKPSYSRGDYVKYEWRAGSGGRSYPQIVG